MKRLFIIFFSITFLFSSLYGSGKTEKQRTNDKKYKVTFIIPGFIGDKSYNESIFNGIQLIRNNLGNTVDTNVISLGLEDGSTYLTTLTQVAQTDTDLIITGTKIMKEPLKQVAKQYPDKKFILYDATVDFSTGNFQNVYTIEYKQNEAGYLAGILSSSLTTSTAMEQINEKPLIGFIGLRSDSDTEKSVVGFREGAQYSNPHIQILTNYVDSYIDAKTAHKQALQQYAKGVDIIFTTAGFASKGVIEAALETAHYVIGIYPNQTSLYQNEPNVKYILTSALKDIGASLYLSVQKSRTGSLPFGLNEKTGLASGIVGLSRNDLYLSSVPASVQLQVQEAHDRILDGSIVLDSTSSRDLL